MKPAYTSQRQIQSTHLMQIRKLMLLNVYTCYSSIKMLNMVQSVQIHFPNIYVFSPAMHFSSPQQSPPFTAPVSVPSHHFHVPLFHPVCGQSTSTSQKLTVSKTIMFSYSEDQMNSSRLGALAPPRQRIFYYSYILCNTRIPPEVRKVIILYLTQSSD